MSGGITQLVAIGAQDVHLTGQPEVSFFRSTYKRHTNFSMTTERQVIQGTVGARNMSTVRFERKGDMLGYVYLVGHDGMESKSISWAGVVDKIQFLVGGQIIDEHDYTFTSNIAPDLFSQNLAKSDTGIRPNGGASYFYPLRFFFCENWQSALPLIALQYHDVEIRIYWGAGALGTAATQFDCFANFVYLDTDERMALSNQPQNMLIYQVQKSIASGSSKVQDLAFNHPIKYLASYDNAAGGSGLFSDANKVKLQLNGTDVADYKFAVPHFTRIISYYHVPFASDNNDTLFVFPFCLDTSKIQPTGSLNFSRLDSARIISQSDNITDDVYAVNYNILRIQAGMGGLVYAN